MNVKYNELAECIAHYKKASAVHLSLDPVYYSLSKDVSKGKEWKPNKKKVTLLLRNINT